MCEVSLLGYLQHLWHPLCRDPEANGLQRFNVNDSVVIIVKTIVIVTRDASDVWMLR